MNLKAKAIQTYFYVNNNNDDNNNNNNNNNNNLTCQRFQFTLVSKLIELSKFNAKTGEARQGLSVGPYGLGIRNDCGAGVIG